MKYLLIAEKNSLMNDVIKCYNNHQSEIINKIGYIDFIALSGHVCTIYEPNDYDEWANKKWGEVDYPMIPNHWQIKVIDDAGKRRVVSQIKNMINNYDGVIVATDSDVEGYGIYYLLENYLNITDMKAYRFIEHSLTDKEILQSLLEMTDFHTDIKHQRFVKSFLIRSRADWLYGMNATRMLSNKMGNLIATGRVKAPTIKLVYDNSLAIENFKPENYWNANMVYDGFVASLTEDGKTAKAYKQESDIPENISLNGIVKSKETKRTYTSAPKLYDLAAIQAEAGQHYGFSPEETLEIVQSLYEKHKLLSYPRTQCRYVSYEKSKEFVSMLKNMDAFDNLRDLARSITNDDIKRVMGDKNVVNDVEVQKESHDALLPTSNKPDLTTLSANEKTICEMVYKRLLAQFLPKLEEDKTVLVTVHDGFDFVAKGKIVIHQGWRVLYGLSKDNIIPNVNEGDNIQALKMESKKRTTVPPKRLTEATLLNAMINIASTIEDKELKKNLAESKGIGTPATRANIIKDIIERGYVESRKNKELYITDAGKAYIQGVKDLDIISPVFAALLETKIHKIQRGEIEYQEVYDDMINSLNSMCKQINDMRRPNNKVDERCPICNSQLGEDNFCYVCNKCGFKVSKKICGKVISEDILKIILSGKATPFYNFKKKDGTSFRARLVLINNEVKFNSDSDLSCPKCGNKNIKLNNAGAFCDCGLKIFRNVSGHPLRDEEIKKLIDEGSLWISNYKAKSGNICPVTLKLEDGNVKYEFPQRK